MMLPGIGAAEVASLAGGVGLFLLGMRLMTDGLKTAAGERLKTILGSWTSNRGRGFITGAVITALVQSSSAVVVAIVGFVNAGLLTLSQAVWLVFGANVGTTMTGWLVALIGVKIKMEALALPLIGIGMALRLLSASRGRAAAFGLAIAGLGLFFLGIDILQKSFSSIGDDIGLAGLTAHPVTTTLLFLGLGTFLTVLVQSSSAAMAIVLTAAAGDAVPLSYAAAAVIGTNIGTTSTAVFASIGATPNARRVAAAHIVFNLIAAVAAIALLPLILPGIEALRDLIGLGAAPATTLALFHTTFNLLGVVLMWPFSAMLVRVLQRMFRSPVEDLASPRYLDANLLAVPELSLAGLVLETNRLGALARSAVHKALNGQPFETEREAARQLAGRIEDHVAAMSATPSPEPIGAALASVLRAVQHFEEVAERAERPSALSGPLGGAEDTAQNLIRQVDTLVGLGRDENERIPVAAAEAAMAEVEAAYQALKARLLDAASRGAFPVSQTDRAIRTAANLRRLSDRCVRAAVRLAPLEPAEPERAKPRI
ncbi:Na/Pi cotransporter family protein [Pseudorhodoplanes sp.]|uniref:Na/Pi cotransporter family protein n=1 Tax=Pseudorhodoplanes sp. TaxID=1934341 RepID=UPI00391CA787